MKQFKFTSLALAFVLAAMPFFQSCDDDPCKDVECLNGGTCFEGVCICELGFSGANCDVEDLCITNSVNCLNGGTCDAGICACATGYEGDSCQTETRTQYQGTWAVADVCSGSGSATYSVTVGPGTNISDVVINNFWDAFVLDVTASVNGTSITIPRQEPDADDFFVEGSGTISGTTITWTYDITDETDPANIVTDACTSTWTK